MFQIFRFRFLLTLSFMGTQVLKNSTISSGLDPSRHILSQRALPEINKYIQCDAIRSEQFLRSFNIEYRDKDITLDQIFRYQILRGLYVIYVYFLKPTYIKKI